MFLQFTPAYGFAFLQSGILPRAVFHKPPGRKTRCGKRTQTAVFHTVFAPQARRGNSPPSGDDAEVTPSGANAPAPPRGRLMAMPETLPPPPKAVPLGKVASPQAMTEGANSPPRLRGKSSVENHRLCPFSTPGFSPRRFVENCPGGDSRLEKSKPVSRSKL